MKKVLVFGTFDILHPGHLNFFEQARKVGDYLVVVVGTDKNVERIKGRLPYQNQELRIKNLENQKLVDRVLLGPEDYSYMRLIKKENPAVIALGYDQNHDQSKLNLELKEAGLDKVKVVRLKPFKPTQYKSSILKSKKELTA